MMSHDEETLLAERSLSANCPWLPGRPGLMGLALLGSLAAACEDERFLAIDDDAHDFGQVHMTEPSEAKTFTIRNEADRAFSRIDVSVQPAGHFEVSDTSCGGWLESGATCTVTVVFAPLLAGAHSADLVVAAGFEDIRATLSGTGAATVRVVNPVGSQVTVRSEPAGIVCGAMCEATFTTPDVVLSVEADEQGTPAWSGPCVSRERGLCKIRLSGDASMELVRFDVGLLWIEDFASWLALAVDDENNVIGANQGLFKLSPNGELLWRREELAAAGLAVDFLGNVGFHDYEPSLGKVDRYGNLLWRIDLAERFTYAHEVAFDVEGNVFVTGTLELPMMERIARLAKFSREGELLWARDRAMKPWSSFDSLAVSRDGQVFVAGSEGTIAVFDGGYSYTIDGYFVRAYDGAGNVLWSQEDPTEQWSSLTVNPAGNLFAAIRQWGEFGECAACRVVRGHGADGALLWEAANDRAGYVLDLATTPTGDVVALMQHYAEGYVESGVSVLKIDGSDGSRRRPVDILIDEGSIEAQRIAVDGTGDVLISGGESPARWLRKYDGALFDRPPY
jgi:hypothetical protein